MLFRRVHAIDGKWTVGRIDRLFNRVDHAFDSLDVVAVEQIDGSELAGGDLSLEIARINRTWRSHYMPSSIAETAVRPNLLAIRRYASWFCRR